MCEKETALEHENGGRVKLHLVVLGHVDAGKSTLMGRLLYDLGAIGQKEMHKNEKAAAEMGKVRSQLHLNHHKLTIFYYFITDV